MRAGAWIVALGLLCGCGAEQPPADEASSGLELPVAGVVGMLPPRAGRVTLEVGAAGALTVDGRPCAWDALVSRLDEASAPPPTTTDGPRREPIRARMTAEVVEEELEEAADDSEEVKEQEIVVEEPVIADEEIGEAPAEDATQTGVTLPTLEDVRPQARPAEPVSSLGLRNADVLLRIDRRAPWALVVRVMEAAASPRTKLRRLFYAVRGADGRGEGALGVFLAVDTCASKGVLPGVEVSLRLAKAEAQAEATALARSLHAFRTRPEDLLAVGLRAPGGAPFGDVMLAIDAALQAGAVEIRFERPPDGDRRRDAAAWCADAAQAPRRAWRPREAASGPGPTTPIPGPGRAAGYAGVVNDMAVGDDLEEEPVLEDEEAPRPPR